VVEDGEVEARGEGGRVVALDAAGADPGDDQRQAARLDLRRRNQAATGSARERTLLERALLERALLGFGPALQDS
jgi:hypothetical protein